jgi:hypothetical protein
MVLTLNPPKKGDRAKARRCSDQRTGLFLLVRRYCVALLGSAFTRKRRDRNAEHSRLRRLLCGYPKACVIKGSDEKSRPSLAAFALRRADWQREEDAEQCDADTKSPRGFSSGTLCLSATLISANQIPPLVRTSFMTEPRPGSPGGAFCGPNPCRFARALQEILPFETSHAGLIWPFNCLETSLGVKFAMRKWASVFGLVVMAAGICAGFALLTSAHFEQAGIWLGTILVSFGSGLQIFGAWPRKRQHRYR